ncbi:MAG: YrzE family protein [Verrucomicrobiae bacterium]
MIEPPALPNADGQPGDPAGPEQTSPPEPRLTGLAIPALVLGILSIPAIFFGQAAAATLSSVAFIAGITAAKLARDNPQIKGAAFGVVGAALGVAAFIISLIVMPVAGKLSSGLIAAWVQQEQPAAPSEAPSVPAEAPAPAGTPEPAPELVIKDTAEELFRKFTSEFLQAIVQKDAQKRNAFYAPKVSYYGKDLTRQAILTNDSAYAAKWPVRDFQVQESEVKVEHLATGDFAATFTVRVNKKNTAAESSESVEMEVKARAADGSFQIYSERPLRRSQGPANK